MGAHCVMKNISKSILLSITAAIFGIAVNLLQIGKRICEGRSFIEFVINIIGDVLDVKYAQDKEKHK